jgi:tetratricopeptide (TPR) repeat protein
MIAQQIKPKNVDKYSQEVSEACLQAKNLEDSGEYEEAAKTLGDLWIGNGERPVLEDLSEEIKAEVLVRIGALTGWLGSSRQIEGFQEKAKDLIGEGVRIFENLGKWEKSTEAQSDLGICYWREGANLEAQQFLYDSLNKLPSKSHYIRGKILLRLVNIAISTRKYRDALSYLEKAKISVEKYGDDLLKGKFYFHKAFVYKLLFEDRDISDYANKAENYYKKASYHYNLANHRRYEANVENNFATLLLSMNNFREAHEHIDNAIHLLNAFNDIGNAPTFFDTKARIFIAENKLIEASVFAQKAVQLLQEGDEHSLLAEFLTTLGIVYARQKSFADAKESFEKAIEEADYVSDVESSAIAMLTQIEEMQSVLSDEEKTTLFKNAKAVLSNSDNQKTQKRLETAAKICLKEEDSFDWENFNLPEEVRKCEAKYIKKALTETNGSVTKAAKLLGISHQNLSLLLKNRHKDLAYAKKPRRRRSDRKKPKAK